MQLLKQYRGFGLFHLLIVLIVVVALFIAFASHRKGENRSTKVGSVNQEKIETSKTTSQVDTPVASADDGKAIERHVYWQKAYADISAIEKVLDEEWIPALRVAEATARISLSGPVQNLQAIRRKISAMPEGTCGRVGKRELLEYTDIVIDRFLAFMQDSPPKPLWETSASNRLMSFRSDVEMCKNSAQTDGGFKNNN